MGGPEEDADGDNHLGREGRRLRRRFVETRAVGGGAVVRRESERAAATCRRGDRLERGCCCCIYISRVTPWAGPAVAVSWAKFVG